MNWTRTTVLCAKPERFLVRGITTITISCFRLTDHFFPNGLEHHQSSDNRAPERMLLDPDLREKLRRFACRTNSRIPGMENFAVPPGLATPDFGVPMKGRSAVGL